MSAAAPGLLVSFAGLILGAAAASCASFTASFVMLCLAIWLLLLVARRNPQITIVLALGLLVLAETKFRARDPGAILAGEIDAQIIFELSSFALACLASLAAIRSSSSYPHFNTPSRRLLLAYSLLAVLSAAWSPVPALSAVRGFQLLVILLAASSAVRILGPDRSLSSLFTCLTIYVIVIAALAAVFPPITDVRVARGRFSWFSVHPIDAGVLAASAGLFVLARIAMPPSSRLLRLRAPLSAVLLSLIAVLAATVSRGPMAAFLAASFLLLVRSLPAPIPVSAAATVVLVLAIAASPLATPQRILRIGESSASPLIQFLYRGQTSDELLTLTGRTELWVELIPIFEEAPILGHGFLASRGILEGVSWSRGGHAHNGVIQTVLDLGAVGLLLLCWAAGRALYPGLARRSSRLSLDRHTGALISATVTFLLFSSITDVSYAGAPGYETLALFICVIAAEEARRLDGYSLLSVLLSNVDGPQSSKLRSRDEEPGLAQLLPTSGRSGLGVLANIWISARPRPLLP